MKRIFFFILVGILLWNTSVRAGNENLLLVNRFHPLPAQEEDDLPLVPLRWTRQDGRKPQRMRPQAAEALDAMLDEAARVGFSDLSVTSAYRCRAEQAVLFETAKQRYLAAGYSEKDALRLTKRYHAAPGESEHETGLAADLHNLPAASVAFAKTEAYHWLLAHAADYGYILRYPAGKEDVTGIAFEPWHFRYVGVEAAKEIAQNGLTLEEYLGE